MKELTTNKKINAVKIFNENTMKRQKSFISLIFIARQHTDVRYWYSKSVCLSVRYVPVPDENGLTYRIVFSPYGSPMILVLPASNTFTKFRRGHPNRGR